MSQLYLLEPDKLIWTSPCGPGHLDLDKRFYLLDTTVNVPPEVCYVPFVFRDFMLPRMIVVGFLRARNLSKNT